MYKKNILGSAKKFKIVAINFDSGSAFVEDERNNIYRVDILPISIFTEINRNAFSTSKAFMHGYSILDKPIEMNDREEIFNYLKDQWTKKQEKEGLKEKSWEEILSIILKYSNKQGVKNIINDTKKYLENGEYYKACVFIKCLHNIKKITKHENIKNDKELYNDILKLKEEYKEKVENESIMLNKTPLQKQNKEKRTINTLYGFEKFKMSAQTYKDYYQGHSQSMC
jgi:hypothetical protein